MADQEPPETAAAPREATNQRSGRVRQGVALIEQGIAGGVVLLLLVGVLLVFWNIAVELGRGFTEGVGELGLTALLSQALLALMIAEIISSVGSYFDRGRFNAGPLLVIGIIASIRRLLVISAEAANFASEGMEIPQSMLIELAIVTVSIGVFAWAIRQLDGTSQAT